MDSEVFLTNRNSSIRRLLIAGLVNTKIKNFTGNQKKCPAMLNCIVEYFEFVGSDTTLNYGSVTTFDYIDYLKEIK